MPRIFRPLVLLALLAGLLLPMPALAKSSYLSAFKSRYPHSSLGTRMNCTLCHPGNNYGSFTRYGQAFRSKSGSASSKLQQIEGLDSDGDGFTNLKEITAGTDPSNASAKPPTPPAKVTLISRSGYVAGLLQTGQKVYADRTYLFANPVPARFRGQAYLRTMNRDKDLATAGLLSFTVDQPVTVYLALDSRITVLPLWLKGWTRQTDRLMTGDPTPARTLYAHAFAKGRVTLGPNRDAKLPTGRSMYSVIILPAKSPAKALALDLPLSVKIMPQKMEPAPIQPAINAAKDWAMYQ